MNRMRCRNKLLPFIILAFLGIACKSKAKKDIDINVPPKSPTTNHQLGSDLYSFFIHAPLTFTGDKIPQGITIENLECDSNTEITSSYSEKPNTKSPLFIINASIYKYNATLNCTGLKLTDAAGKLYTSSFSEIHNIENADQVVTFAEQFIGEGEAPAPAPAPASSDDATVTIETELKPSSK